jgi:pimeloyl-ACP methyl ester carboxylesterase
MSIKNILITEPANPVLRQLTMGFLHKPDLRLVCFGKGEDDGEEQLLQMLFASGQDHLWFKECRGIVVDEIWHALDLADSIEECRKKTERALSFANRQKAPAFHYLSVSTVAALRVESFPSDTPRCSNDQKRLLNETAIEQFGRNGRIYRLPLSPEELFHPGSGWAQFVRGLSHFKREIEDRIPGYFSAQPLRLYLPEGGTIDLARSDDMAQAIEGILKSGMNGPCFHLRTPQPLVLEECLRMLTESAGVRLQIVASHEHQNYVDRVFGSRMEKVLEQLERSAQVTTEVAPDTSLAGHAWLSVPSISPQELIAEFHSKSYISQSEPRDWKSGLEQKQVLLSDGSHLNYYIGGEGQETLVLLNAYGQSFRYWERFIQAVFPKLRIVLWTARGNDGDTIGLKIANALAVHADDLEKVLQQEKIESCTLLAWCSGPKLALEYYQRYPDRISSMIFVAASFKGLRQHRALETEYEKNLEPLLEAIEKYPETADVVLEYLKGILLSQGKQARSIDELAAIFDRDLQQALSAVNVSLKELVLHPFHGANVVAYAKQMCDFWKHDFVAGLDKVRAPVLFVGGDCDRIASQAIAKVIAGMMPQARYLEIDGGTHYIHYDQWDMLAEIAGQILESGGRLEFNTSCATMSKLNHEPAAARQS